MDAINAIGREHGLVVIEDAAQSFGATYRGKSSCDLSAVGCTSFFPSKPLGCYGDGGAIFTSDDELAQAMREIRVHGQSQRYRHTRIGVGGRMDTLQCAIVLAKLIVFEQELERRRRVAAVYDRLFAGRIETMKPASGCASAYAQYTVLLKDRPMVQSALQLAGVPSAVHYPLPIHMQPAYAHFDDAACPVAEMLAEHVLSLPMGPYLSSAHAEKVAGVVLAAAQ